MKKALFYIVLLFFFTNCTEDFDDNPKSTSVNDFVWKGLNQYYYWLEESPDLNDAKRNDYNDYNNFINSFNTPESLFEHLLVDRNRDRFSVIFSDYTKLEQALSGTTGTTGADIELRFKNGSQTELFGWVRYVMPNSNAASTSLTRGSVFYAVNNTPLTTNNYRSLLNNSSYTLQLADYENGLITPNGQTVTLSKTPYSENPVFFSTIINQGNKKIGYLMYNGFYSQYEQELNDAFTFFKNNGTTHLIVDLRYNSGGSLNTCTRLASMITGQFTNQVFSIEQWNYKIRDYLGQDNERFFNKFSTSLSNGAAITNLNLNSVYFITSKSTASASELLINGLKPYVNVVQFGTTTTGKNVGSITIYDSPTFRKTNVNPSHKYAMQPIVLKIANKVGFSDYTNGLDPNVIQNEDIGNLGTIGNTTEPLLQTVLNYISTNGRYSPPLETRKNISIINGKSLSRFGEEMYK